MSQEQNKDMSQYFYRASAADFMKIPSSPLTYWASKEITKLFSYGLIGEKYEVREGLGTRDDEIFLRRFWEVSENKVRKGNGTEKWVKTDKAGQFRKWYGNAEFVMNWENDGFEIRNHRNADGSLKSRPQNTQFFFKEAISWNKVGSGITSFRWRDSTYAFNDAAPSIFGEKLPIVHAMLCSKLFSHLVGLQGGTLNVTTGIIKSLPLLILDEAEKVSLRCRSLTKQDWDSAENSLNFQEHQLLSVPIKKSSMLFSYNELRGEWQAKTDELHSLEESNNRLFIESYGLQDELTPEVPLEEITLTCNPHYRYGGNRSTEELETLLQCDTLRELVSYAIGCMMGRYSLDKPGLILASQGETLQDYLRQIPSPRFVPDDDAILPLTDQEWFADDATNRFREFIRVAWGEEHLQQNLDFVAESLCLHAIKPKKGEASLDTIRRYLSTQFFKDHLRTYKKRPIYWLFSSGKHKAFECLVYLHRYNEGTLARMRTEYVIPLTAKLSTYAAKLEKDVEASTSTAEKKRLEKELTTLHNQQAELATFDETLRHYADQRISLDLDDGVKLNYGKFGDLLAEVKAVTGGASE
ncbi:BREX-1 system adenine-specific DNA-methyltransferase PglX [Stutzerimonas balearica]|uniref:BREX-1 system adenine-specific DNA-methyltransferase PglX n=1 Tax=Stutzerimonas balearica TaxID=74829 RepID=A0A9X7V1Y9_9GAMM|nr:BREX-1 system adenine-specific DNA-methyltransferase PglX [Stutzerimonas balearica]QQN50640.1 BREX-1 system adenine-specific DNA-methyltransferase PglX [Stutzerimonas balearica]